MTTETRPATPAAVGSPALSEVLGAWLPIATAPTNGKKVILAKPTTLMNLSGEAVRALKDFYKLQNSDITVIHDELDLPFGTIKEKQGGGSAGNNGLKSLIAHIGEDFKRIRIGIKNDLLVDSTGSRSTKKMDPSDFVLGKFSAQEKKQLDEIIKATIEKI